jgi:glutamyl-tRNA(Gln) amidotransferase subunit E
VIKKALSSGGVVYGARLPGFAGLLSIQLQPDRRFGTELSDYAKFWGGVGGIFHTDELPKYGITEEETQRLRTTVGAREIDAVVIVAADAISSRDALTAVIQRAREATQGVPAETRMPLPDGTTKYARPRPGAERMYPETDVRPVKITQSRLRAIRKSMPETLEEKERRFTHEFGLSQELAAQMVRSTRLELFESIMKRIQIQPTLVAVTLENTLISLNREGVPTESLTDNHLFDVFDACSSGRLSPEAIPGILTFLSKSPESNVQQALESTGMTRVASEEVEGVVRRVVGERIDFIRSQGARAAGGLMGVVMAELKGRTDGKTVRALIDAEIARVLSQTER